MFPLGWRETRYEIPGLPLSSAGEDGLASMVSFVAGPGTALLLPSLMGAVCTWGSASACSSVL